MFVNHIILWYDNLTRSILRLQKGGPIGSGSLDERLKYVNCTQPFTSVEKQSRMSSVLLSWHKWGGSSDQTVKTKAPCHVARMTYTIRIHTCSAVHVGAMHRSTLISCNGMTSYMWVKDLKFIFSNGAIINLAPSPILNKKPVGHIAHLRKQFKLINTYDLNIIMLIKRRKIKQYLLNENWMVLYLNKLESPSP